MENIIRFTTSDLAQITNYRCGEVKFGEQIQVIPPQHDVVSFLQNSEAPFVLVGIPEDIGVRANFGRRGAHTAWETALQSIANIQHNRFCKGYSLVILGKVDVEKQMQAMENLDFKSTEDRVIMSALVSEIDKEVVHVISTIISTGKTPIIIGGGHNNAYGNIKGTALAKGKPINAINFDAHSDFRILEGRHSGNGFSYAYEEGFLKKYFIFGLHENYTSKSVLSTLKKIEDRVRYVTYDSINIRKEKEFEQEMIQALDFINQESFGVEIDLGSIPNIASSTMTLTGFSVEELRRFVSFFGKFQNATYLHLCEGAPDLGEEKNDHLIGKIIGHLITDFIKSNNQNENQQSHVELK